MGIKLRAFSFQGAFAILMFLLLTAVGRGTATPTPPATPRPSWTATPAARASSTVVYVTVPSNGDAWKAALIAAIFAVVAAGITARVAWVAATRSVWQRANEEEIKRLQGGLEEFYGPFMRLLDVTFLMSQDLRFRLNDTHYRMLLRLTDANWLPGLSTGDRVIVEEVLTNDAQLEALILEKSGGRVDPDVDDYLSHAVAHFRMMKRARAGDLKPSDEGMLRPYVFPKLLRDVIRLQRDHVQARITALRLAPYKPTPRYLPLELEENMKAQKWPDPERADV